MATSLKEDFIIKHMVKKYNKKPIRDAEALIFTYNLTHATIVKFKKEGSRSRRKGVDSTKLVNLAESVGDHIVFVKSKPKNKYTVLGTVKQDDLRDKNYKHDYLVKLLLGKAKENHSDFDALIMVEGKNLSEAEVIKFN